MSEVMEAPTLPAQATAVAVINPAGAFGSPGAIKALVERIQQDARAQAAALDISSEKGRKAIASLAHKVARSKTAIDEAGKALNESKRAEIAVVDADRRWARETLDDLKTEVRKQLTDWEEADESRIAAHKTALAVINEMVPGLPAGASTEHISGLLATLKTNQPREWQEFTVLAGRATAEAVTALQAAWDQAYERECNAAAERERKAEETERKRQAAALAQKEREEKIAADAKREAEERAAQAEIAREVAEARVEQERIAAHGRALTALRGMIADTCAPENGSSLIRLTTKIFDRMAEHTRDWQDYRDQYDALITEGRAKIAERLAVVEGQEADQRAAAAEKERLLEIERDRIKTERDEINRQAERAKAERERADADDQQRHEAQQRADNTTHRKAVSDAAVGALIAAGLSRGAALTAVKAIAAGSIPHVVINY